MNNYIADLQKIQEEAVPSVLKVILGRHLKSKASKANKAILTYEDMTLEGYMYQVEVTNLLRLEGFQVEEHLTRKALVDGEDQRFGEDVPDGVLVSWL